MRMTCPQCLKEYDTILDYCDDSTLCIQDTFPNAPPWQREQCITGICSDACWDALLGPEEEEEPEILLPEDLSDSDWDALVGYKEDDALEEDFRDIYGDSADILLPGDLHENT